MYPESDYYQISGYQAHSHNWFKKFDDKPLIREIMTMKSKLFRTRGEDSPVELVLGILPSGASYLLMTGEQMQTFTLKHRLNIPKTPWRASDFRSLSPIYFNSTDELSAKFATYKQRPRNKNRRDHEKPLDNSQANRGFVQPGPNDTAVLYRDYFEQQRTLYRLVTRDLEPGKVGLVTPPWLGGVRIVSLVLGEWTVDNRPRTVRLNDPRLVDVGWTDALLPSFFENLTGSTVHLKLESTVKMINPGSKNPYFSQVVEDDLAGLYQRLRDLLSHDANKSGIPLIVLVHDEDMARGLLSRAGINLDLWSSGLSNLLPIAPVKSRYKVEEHTPTPAILPGPSIVDVKTLVKTVMQTNAGHTVPHSAKVLHVQTDTKTCAGDDSLLLLRMWTSMAEGLAIDEQHKQREDYQPDCARVLAPPQAQTDNADVNPNDSDPNDSDPNDVDIPPGPRPTRADDFSDDDDDW
ncbi:hypothetical protein EV363DRAFT_1341549 [Boletus edulis]|nr:hypothetical protein EV363DRAFT_1341549 [Boletus edulis]